MQRVRDFFYDGLYAPEFGNPTAPGPDTSEPGSPDAEWGGEGGAPGAEAPEFPTLGFVVAGLSAASYYSEVWTVTIESDGRCTGPEQRFGQGESGVADFWGMPEALYRLVYGWSHEAHLRVVQAGIAPEMADQLLVSRTELAHPGMPLQDAIDLVEYLADVTVGYVRFKQGVPAVAPPIDIAVVTRHQGFKWVARKHYFTRDLNPPADVIARTNKRMGAI